MDGGMLLGGMDGEGDDRTMEFGVCMHVKGAMIKDVCFFERGML